MYEPQISIPDDLVAHLLRYVQTQAAAEEIQVPGDFDATLNNLNISEFISSVGAGLAICHEHPISVEDEADKLA